MQLPGGDLPKGFYSQKANVVGRGVVLPIARGDYVLPGKLAGENAGYGLPSLIPPGMRAVSVRVNDTTSVAGFVQPGTRVDVMVTGNPAGSGEQQTTTVLENIEVIATGQKLERNQSGDAQTAAVITLLVLPDDAQKLTLASTQGRIQLALRNPLDTKQQDLPSTKSGSIYKNVSAPVPVARQKPKHAVAETPPAPPAFYVGKPSGETSGTQPNFENKSGTTQHDLLPSWGGTSNES